jgi:hypothetical protein
MRHRLVTVTILAVLLSGAAWAGDAHLAVVRVESLDAVVRDAQHIAKRLGVEISGQNLMQPLTSALGIPDLGWVDGSKPIVVVLPSAAMMLGQKGILAALPVSDHAQGLATLQEMTGVTPSEQDGVHTFTPESGEAFTVASSGGYMVVGAMPSLVTGFDPAAALSMSGLPNGSISAEIFLEPIAPMAMMGLQMGRQALEQQMAEDAEIVEPPHGELEGQEGADEDHAHGEPVVAQGFDPAAMSGLFDLYFDFIKDALNNTSRIQLSLEVATSHVIAHKRMIPKAGSTLAELVDAQEGGIPELARLIDPESASAVYAGQLQMTPAFLAATRGYFQRYVEVMKTMTSAFSEEPEAAWIAQMMEPFLQESTIDQTFACYRGDFAGGYSFGEGGIRTSQVVGMKDMEACNALMALWTGIAAKAAPGGEPMFDVTENALTYKGIATTKMVFALPDTMFEGMDEAQVEAARKAMAQWYGDGSIEAYMGFSGDKLLSATGGSVEEAYKALVDRAAKKKPAGGIAPGLFAPLAEGPGMFGMFDLVKFMREMPLDELGGDAEALAFLDYVPAEATRITFAARFDPGAINLEMALPLGWLDAIGQALDKQDAEEAAEQAALQKQEG